MSKSLKDQKNDLFTLYAENLSIYRPEYIDKFLCPICLKEFDRSQLDSLAIAHVFPEKLGGRLLTFSCAACDNKIGGEFNWHAVQEKKARERIKEPKYGRFIPESGQAINIISDWDFKTASILIYPPKGMPPEIWHRWIEEIRRNSSDGSPYKFSIESKEIAFVPTKRDISYIHSAFLMMFYRFGYEYILSPNADIIRQMFNGCDLSWKPSKLVRSLNKATESQRMRLYYPIIGIIVEPKGLCSFAVFLPSLNEDDSANVVFLPGINDDFSYLYKNLTFDQTLNEKLKVVFPKQYVNESYTMRANFDICDPRTKGCANILYLKFTIMTESEILNAKANIKISEKLFRP